MHLDEPPAHEASTPPWPASTVNTTTTALTSIPCAPFPRDGASEILPSPKRPRTLQDPRQGQPHPPNAPLVDTSQQRPGPSRRKTLPYVPDPPFPSNCPSLHPSVREDGALDVFDERGRRFISDLFLDNSSPLLKWENFKHPLLRQFPKHGQTIKWHKCEGQGVEGGVFKATFGDDGTPYAVKIVRLFHLASDEKLTACSSGTLDQANAFGLSGNTGAITGRSCGKSRTWLLLKRFAGWLSTSTAPFLLKTAHQLDEIWHKISSAFQISARKMSSKQKILFQ